MDRSDMTYINPGNRDHIYIRKFEGRSQNVQKRNLLWKLRNVLDIVNGNEIVGFQNGNLGFQDRFEKKLSFSMLYNFFQKSQAISLEKKHP